MQGKIGLIRATCLAELFAKQLGYGKQETLRFTLNN